MLTLSDSGDAERYTIRLHTSDLVMRSFLFVVASFGATILAWGLYGWLLHHGQHEMSTAAGELARLRPFIGVGLAYFAIGVVVPLALLTTRGERGGWSSRGAGMSLFAGALGAIGALGIIMAFTFGGKPSFVMPLVFGGAPVVNSFLTIYWAKRAREIGPVFLAGLVMVVLGAVTVLVFRPSGGSGGEGVGLFSLTFLAQLFSIATTVACWGAYGPVLHQGQAAMNQSRLRPLLCVGIAYFAIAVAVPWVLLTSAMPEPSEFNLVGTLWSLGAGAAGAVGALGIILAFNFGGKPIYVMPLVFGGAPVVNTFATLVSRGQYGEFGWRFSLFLAGLILVIAGSAMVLVFAPKGGPPKRATPEPDEDAIDPTKTAAGSDDPAAAAES